MTQRDGIGREERGGSRGGETGDHREDGAGPACGGEACTPARPYLVREQLLLGGAGAGDRGCIHVPAAPRGF